MPARKLHRSRILPVVLLGFALILMMLGVFGYVSSRQANQLVGVLDQSGNILLEMDLIEQLIELARSRTLLTQRMPFIEDPDERDRAGIELSERAARFAELRLQLLELPLTPELKGLLDEQRPFIRLAYEQQKKAEDLALLGGTRNNLSVGKILATRVYPAQAGIIDRFLEMQRIENSRLTDILARARGLEASQQRLKWIMVLLMFVGGLVIVLFMIRVIRRMEERLLHEREKAGVTLGNISDAVVSVDRDGQVEYANPVTASLFGKTLAELESTSIIDLLGSGGEGIEALSERICNLLELGSQEVGAEHFRISLAHRPKQPSRGIPGSGAQFPRCQRVRGPAQQGALPGFPRHADQPAQSSRLRADGSSSPAELQGRG